MYKLKLSRREKKELALSKWLLLLLAVVGLGLIVWLAWIRPAQREASINSFETCRAAGNRIQESYPEVCLTKNGKRFVNPAQNQAHQASLLNKQELTPPTDPKLLYLDIPEWNIRLPLTDKTFDLSYVYLEDGLNDRVRFSYKRLIAASVCPGDVGLTLSRLVNQRQPPYTADNPAPIAHVDAYYYYVVYAGSPCYDTENAEQVALVQKIAGEQSLVQATTSLLAGLQPLQD